MQQKIEKIFFFSLPHSEVGKVVKQDKRKSISSNGELCGIIESSQ